MVPPEAPPARPATLRDVAEAAGISPAGASYALRGLRVSEATSRRVREAAERIGYRADPIARALRGGATDVVGVVGGSLADYWHQDFASRLGRHLGNAGLHMVLSDAHGDVDAQLALARALVGQRVDALVVLPAAARPRGWDEIAAAVPTVAVGAPLPAPAASIRFATRRGLDLGLAELERLGHRRVLVLSTGRVSVPAGRDVRVARCGFSSSDAQAAAAAELRRRRRPTAVLALSDSLAYGVYGACRDLGLEVGADVSVVGFDDLPPSRLLAPALTAVGWDTARAARTAAAMVAAALAGEPAPGTVVMTPRLARRDSARPPRPSRRGGGGADNRTPTPG